MLASLLERFEDKFRELERRIGYTFKRRGLLLEALTHRSFAAEEGLPFDNERLEFLGDAFLNYAVGHHIFSQAPDATEGQLTQKRAQLVREETLAQAARRIGLGDFLLLGRGERLQGGNDRDSNLADAFEALVGAVVLDGGVKSARALVKRLLIKADLPPFVDYKSSFYHLCRCTGYPIPTVRAKRDGKLMRVDVKCNGLRVVVFGKTRREAERVAFEIAHKRLFGGEIEL